MIVRGVCEKSKGSKATAGAAGSLMSYESLWALCDPVTQDAEIHPDYHK